MFQAGPGSSICVGCLVVLGTFVNIQKFFKSAGQSVWPYSSTHLQLSSSLLVFGELAVLKLHLQSRFEVLQA